MIAMAIASMWTTYYYGWRQSKGNLGLLMRGLLVWCGDYNQAGQTHGADTEPTMAVNPTTVVRWELRRPHPQVLQEARH